MTASRTIVVCSAFVVLAAGIPGAGAWDSPSETAVLVTGRVDEWYPVGNGAWLAWSQNSPRAPEAFDVFALPAGGSRYRVNSGGTDAYSGGLDGNLLAYTLIPPHGDTDLQMFDLVTRTKVALPNAVNSRLDEADPSISGSRLLFTRERDGGRYLKRLLLLDLSGGGIQELDRIRRPRRFLLAGQVSGDFVVWQRCGANGPCNVFRYAISSGVVTPVPNPGDKLHYSPGVAPDGTVYYFRSGVGCGADPELRRFPAGPDGGVVVDFPANTDGSSAFVFVDGAGASHVLYSRSRCLGMRTAEDIYEVVPG